MKKYFILIAVSVILFYACKEQPKCCCTNFSLIVNINLKDSSKTLDTNYIKNNNDLYYYSFSDTLLHMQLQANIDSTENDRISNTINLLKISPIDTDTIITEINGTCGRTVTKAWYNGILINSKTINSNIKHHIVK